MLRCPSCKAVGLFSLSSSYSRFYITSPDRDASVLSIPVLQCKVCGKFHAVLPFTVLPFCSYSYPFVLRTLSLFLFGSLRGNKTKVCNRMRISRHTLNHWIYLYSREQVRRGTIRILLHAVHMKNFDLKLFRDFILTFCSVGASSPPFLIFTTLFSFDYSLSNHLAS